MLGKQSRKIFHSRIYMSNIMLGAAVFLVFFAGLIIYDNFFWQDTSHLLTIFLAFIMLGLGLVTALLAFLYKKDKIQLHNFLNQPGYQQKIVVIGGGTGLSMLLRGLKEYPVDLTAIVTVADDGGSSGRLRDELEMPPPGDIRNVIVSMANTEPLLEELFQHRFTRGDYLTGHSLGNLLLVALQEITGSFKSAVRELSRVLAIRGQVVPVSEEMVGLVAKMRDGSLVHGESRIPEADGSIQKVFLEPARVRPTPEALEALAKADMIVVGPGSLYTSVLPVLLVEEIVATMRDSVAPKVYISNIMTQKGETARYTASDHVKAIYNHVGNDLFDTIICHTGDIPADMGAKYDAQGAELVKLDMDKLKRLRMRVIAKDLSVHHTYYRHDSRKVSREVIRLLNNK